MNYFNNIGLSENEDKIYLHMTKSGSKTVVELSKFLKISREGVYNILKKLIYKKLIYKKKSVYVSFGYKKLYNKLLDEEKKIKKQKEALFDLIKICNRPRIQAYYGKDWYKNLNNDLKKDSVEDGHIILNSDYLPKFLKSRRSKEKFKNDILINFTNKRKIKKEKEISLKYKNQTGFVSVSIFGKNVAIYSVPKNNNDGYGLLAEDENVANFLKDLIDNIVQ